MAPPPEKYLYSLTMSFTMFQKKKKKNFKIFKFRFFEIPPKRIYIRRWAPET